MNILSSNSRKRQPPTTCPPPPFNRTFEMLFVSSCCQKRRPFSHCDNEFRQLGFKKQKLGAMEPLVTSISRRYQYFSSWPHHEWHQVYLLYSPFQGPPQQKAILPVTFIHNHIFARPKVVGLAAYLVLNGQWSTKGIPPSSRRASYNPVRPPGTVRAKTAHSRLAVLCFGVGHRSNFQFNDRLSPGPLLRPDASFLPIPLLSPFASRLAFPNLQCCLGLAVGPLKQSRSFHR